MDQSQSEQLQECGRLAAMTDVVSYPLVTDARVVVDDPGLLFAGPFA